MKSRLLRVLIAVAIIAAGSVPTISHAQDEGPVATFVAVANAQGVNRAAGRNSNERIEITIDRWSTDEEAAAYLRLFREEGTQALVDKFQSDPPVGFIRVGQRTSYPLSLAREFANDDGTRNIRLATDRRISGWEALNQETTMRFAFNFMELTVDEDNEGDGYAIVGARMSIDEAGQFHIESYDNASIRIGSVRAGR